MGACFSAAADPQALKQQEQQAADPQVSAKGALVPNLTRILLQDSTEASAPSAQSGGGQYGRRRCRCPCRLEASLWFGQAGKANLSSATTPPILQDALWKACQLPGRHSCLAAIHAALAAGAAANAATPSGLTACHIVAHHNPDAEAISAAIPLLVAEGASVDVRYAVNQATALHYAATNPSADAAVAAILALAAAHADVHAKTWSGAEPLVSPWVDWNEGATHSAPSVLYHTHQFCSGCSPSAPQHWVSMQTSAEAAAAVAQTLVTVGADPNARTIKGATTLVRCSHSYARRADSAAGQAASFASMPSPS